MKNKITFVNTENTESEWKSWLICLSAGLFCFYVAIQMNLFDVINKPLRHTFGINANQLSGMSSMAIWMSILFYIPAGFLVDRFSIRKIILVTMALSIIGTFGFGLTSSPLFASAYHSLPGIANAFCFLASVVLASRLFPPNRQALVIGWLITLGFFGGMAAHTPLVYLNEHLGWRNAILLDGVLGLLIFGWMFIIIKDTESKEVEDEPVSMLAGFKRVFTNKQNWWGGLYIACLDLPITVLCTLWGSSYLKKVQHLNDIDSSNLICFLLLGNVLGSPLCGWLSDKLSTRKPIMLFGSLTTTILLIPFLLNIDFSYAWLGVLFFILGLCSSAQCVGFPLISESNSSRITGIATALASILIATGGAVGQMLFGALLQNHAGSSTHHFIATDYGYAVKMLPLAPIISIMSLCFIKETYCSRLSRTPNVPERSLEYANQYLETN